MWLGMAVFSSLSLCPTLVRPFTHGSLSANKIGDAGGLALARVLTQNNTLKTLE
jgi:hypothetical protein